jgi:hypothetical protein
MDVPPEKYETTWNAAIEVDTKDHYQKCYRQSDLVPELEHQEKQHYQLGNSERTTKNLLGSRQNN